MRAVAVRATGSPPWKGGLGVDGCETDDHLMAVTRRNDPPLTPPFQEEEQAREAPRAKPASSDGSAGTDPPAGLGAAGYACTGVAAPAAKASAINLREFSTPYSLMKLPIRGPCDDPSSVSYSALNQSLSESNPPVLPIS